MSSGHSASWASIVPRLQEALAPRYEVHQLLGHGGMAGVYLATETRLGRQVAVKVISPSLVMDESFVARFEQEARATARMRHTNIVTIYEVDHKDDFLYIAMSYCAGRTLGGVMREEPEPMAPAVALAWLYEVASALDHAHHNGIIHRDIKPGNILLDDEGRALVADFGIAKVADQPGLTSTGFLVGTPAYMSPEQCGGTDITTASDQYSLGVVAYEMLTGAKPFEGATMRVIHAHLSEEPKHLSELRPDCPPELANAVMRMLAKAPEDRWPSTTAAIRAAGGAPVARGDDVYKTMTRLSRQVSTIHVSASAIELQPSQQFALEAVAMDATQTPMPMRTLNWTSSDPSVAEVAPDGTVVAKSPGRAVLAIRGGSAEQAVEVEVSDPTGTFVAPPQPEAPVDDPSSLPRPAAEANTHATVVADTELIRKLKGLGDPTPPTGAAEGEGSAPPPMSIPPADPPALAASETAPAVPAPSSGSDSPPQLETSPKDSSFTELFTQGTGDASSGTFISEPSETTPVGAAPSQEPASQEPASQESGSQEPASQEPASQESGSQEPARALSGSKQSTTEPVPIERDNRRMLTLGGVGVAAVVAVVALVSVRGGDAGAPPQAEPAREAPTGQSPESESPNPTSTSSADPTTAAPERDPNTDGPQDSPSATETAETTPPQSTPTQRPDPAPADPQPTQPAAPTTGTLRVLGSAPGGAVVTAVGPDGQTRSVSGSTDLPPGQYRITGMASGYDNVQTTVTVRAGSTETWRPEWVATPAATPEPPAEQPAAPVLSDQEIGSMRAEATAFLAAFAAQDASAVLPLLPSGMRANYEQMLSLNYSRFDLDRGAVGTPTLDGDQATLRIPTTLRTTTQGFSSDSPLNFVATWVRSGSSWTLQSMTPGS